MRARIILGVALLYLAWQGWLWLAAAGKLAPELQGGEGKVNVLVTLPFTPERFHVLAFQRYGRVSGTRDETIEVRGVAREHLRAVARPYWVKSVELMKEEP